MNLDDESNISIFDTIPLEIEERIVKYIRFPTCISVCQRWKGIVDKRPWRHMPIRVHKLRVSRYKWESGRNGLDYKVTSYVIDEAASDEHNKRFIKKSRRCTFSLIFPSCLWMFLPEEFELINLTYDEQLSLMDKIPSWWGFDIKKFSFDRPMIDSLMPFLEVFPNLHSIREINKSIRPPDESDVRELFRNINFIRNYILIIKQQLVHETTDYLLPLISAKSWKLERFYSTDVFSLPAFIKFLKETDFAERVTIRVKYIQGSVLQFRAFLRAETTNHRDAYSFHRTCRFQFEYRGSTIVFDQDQCFTVLGWTDNY